METVQSVLSICEGVSTIGGAAAVIHKWTSPAIKLKIRVETLERQEKQNQETIQRTQERDGLIMETLATMFNSQISGNNTEQLKDTRDKLILYLA